MSTEHLFDINVELYILGCLLIYPKELTEKLGVLEENDFYDGANKKLFNIIRENYSQGVIDLLRILESYPKTEEEEAKRRMLVASECVVTPMYFDEMLLELKYKAQNRRLTEICTDIALGNSRVTLEILKGMAEEEESKSYVKSYAEKSDKNAEWFIENLGVKKERIYTGFSATDRILGGLRQSSVMIIGAAPSAGKTALALNIASRQENVVIFSLEMNAGMIYERLASANCNISYGRFTKQDLKDSEIREITEYMKKVKERGLYVFDDIYDVESQNTVIENIKPNLVVVDYIQKVRTKQKTQDRRNEIEYISGMYKRTAHRNKCVVIVLSQLSRENREKPTMSDLKESGALEADGDYVCILNRPYVVDKKKYNEEEAYLLIDKNKFGMTGKIELHFDGRFQKFREDYRGSTEPYNPYEETGEKFREIKDISDLPVS